MKVVFAWGCCFFVLCFLLVVGFGLLVGFACCSAPSGGSLCCVFWLWFCWVVVCGRVLLVFVLMVCGLR